MLISYVRNDKGQKIGAVVSPGANLVGVSLCNPKDTFSKEMALTLALGRAIRVKNIAPPMPMLKDVTGICEQVGELIDTMYIRSRKYYK
jgi:hypothetical protein